MKKLILLTLLSALMREVHAQDFDAYSNALTGSSRIIGLGGAYYGESSGIEGVFFNPAGIATMESRWDGTFSFGSFRQKIRSSGQNQSFKSSNLTYLYTGLVFKIEKWRDFSFGVSISSPASQKFNGNITSSAGVVESVDYEFNQIEISAPLAFRLVERLYIGANFKIASANMKFRSESNPATSESSVVGAGYDFGLIYLLGEELRLGLTYAAASKLDFEEQRNSATMNFEPFRQARFPHRIFLGSSYQALPEWKFFADIGVVVGMNDTLLPGSRLSSDTPGIQSGQNTNFQYYLGVERKLVPNVWHARAGHYFQPSRAQGDINRYHITGGLDYFFWYIRTGLYFDIARDYFNFGFGLSPSF